MLKKLLLGLAISVLSLTLLGCGTDKAPQQKTGTEQTPSAKAVQLTPIPAGTPVVTANSEVSKQIMAQKDVLGTQIYEQQGMVYGDITFKSEVDKEYAHNLANQFLNQLKVTYPNQPITAQVKIDGEVTDSIPYKP